jgi:HAE1 family hydrophobic/amphiphilic exporter-1
MSTLSRLALSRRSVTLLLAAGLFVSGVLAWGNLKQELLPDVSFPIVTVIAPYPGAGASDVTEQVTKPLERAVSGVAGLDQVQSTSANSFAVLVAQFDYGTNLDDAVKTIQQEVAKADLPSGVTPSVQAFNFNDAPVVQAAVSATAGTDLGTAAAIARTEIVPALQALPGVTAVDLAGGLEDRVVVTLEPAKLAAAGVTIGQVVGILQANNITLPGGEIVVDGSKIPVSTIGRFDSIDQLRSLVVGVRPAAPPAAASGAPVGPGASAAAAPGLVPVTLADLGTVELAEVASTGYGRTNGQPSVTIAVSKSTTANTVTVAREVQAALREIAARHPDQIEVATIFDQSGFILDSSDGLVREGGLGALFAVLTIFLFLFSLRSTLVAAVSIPLSVLTALVVMGAAGITLNILTLGGLAVAVGRVVDDSIVVLENIYRHRALGDDRMTAALKGPREVAGAITASTLTTVAVFLPLGLTGGFVSQFFLAFSLTITFALLASLVVALTVVPVLAYLFIGRVAGSVDETGEPRNSRWVRAYDPLIRLVLRNRWTSLATVAIAALLFGGSIALIPRLPTAFINAGSEKILQVSIAPPSGATSQDVLDRAEQAEAILRQDPEVQLVATSIPGESDVGFGSVLAAQQGRATNSARIVVRLDPSADLEATSAAFAEQLAPLRTDGYDIVVGQQGGMTSNDLQVVVSADDPAVVSATTAAVELALSKQAGLANLSTDLVKAAPEIQVRVNPAKALAAGLTTAQVGAAIRNALVPTTVGRVALGDAPAVALVVRLDPADLDSLAALRALPVGAAASGGGASGGGASGGGASGAPVPLAAVADVSQEAVQARVTRIDGAPSATISAEITSGDTGATSAAVEQTIQGLRDDGTIGPGVAVRLAGVTAQQREAFGGLFFSMAVAIGLVYLAMVLAFNSLITPFIILFSLPLATIGAFPALLLTGRPLGISALIGFLMLIGIVVTNAIVLLDLVERLRAAGHSTRDALIEGGRTRIRPILMTAIATMLALVPVTAGFNEGSIIAAELGTVVIGGLLSSTFLTLLVVPAVFALVDGLKGRLGRMAA